MKFKAKIATPLMIPSNPPARFNTHTLMFEFSKARIYFPKGHYTERIDYLSKGKIICNGDLYTLIQLDSEINKLEWSKDSQYQASFNNTGLIVNLVTTPYNLFRLKYIHKIYWWRRNWADSHPLFNQIRTGVITALFSIAVGILVALWNHQKQDQVDSQQNMRIQALSDELNNVQKKLKSLTH